LPTSNNNTYSLGSDSNGPPGIASSVSKASDQVSTQNLHFVDGDNPWSYNISSSSDATTKLAEFSDAELGSFLSRPLKIKEYQWVPDDTRLFESFNPWTEFFTNSDVLEKINRYRNLRCNLKMKMLINGNSFYYGRALVSYNPYLVNDSVTLNRAFFEQDLVGASQKPHFLLDPTTSQGGEMTLPFLWPENFLDITRQNWTADLGRVTIHDFDVLRHANGGTDPITVSVFLWVENLVLSVPTTSQVQSGFADRELDKFGFPTYVEQAKSMKKADNTSTNDEFVKDGLISKPATAIAAAANALSMIPVIAPYAKATSMVATGLSNMAKMFGYSRPQVLDDTKPYVPRYMGNLSNTDYPETLIKLSVDSKNELTIDTRVMGLGGEDELTISSIAQRPSFWQQFDWEESATTDTLLASMKVQPCLVRTLSASPVVEIHPTALSFAANPFEVWQGSIKFRFNVVCSEYHRGRLRLVYNPKTNNTGPVKYNQVYSTIIDISQDRDFEYEVKWADIRAWNKVLGPDLQNTVDNFSTTEPVTGGAETPLDSNYDNGTLSIYVVNELATPSNTPTSVKVQVWVSGGKDIAFAVPSPTNLMDISYFRQQSAIAPYSKQSNEAPEALATTNDDSNAPLCSNEIETFGSDPTSQDNQYLVYQGERLVSFRDLMRRYNYHASYWPGETGNGTRLVGINLTDFPYYRGWDPNGLDQAVTSDPTVSARYNFCNSTLINYLTPAFVMRRGALRHKVIQTSLKTSGRLGTLCVARHRINGTSNNEEAYPIDDALVAKRRRQMLKSSRAYLGGATLSPIPNNPCIEYETPFYTRGQRFVPARDTDYRGALHNGHQISLEFVNNVGDANTRIDKYISTAEDFQLGLFIGAPVYYVYLDPAASP